MDNSIFDGMKIPQLDISYTSGLASTLMKQVLLNDGEECFITHPEDFIPEIFRLFLCQNGGDTT